MNDRELLRRTASRALFWAVVAFVGTIAVVLWLTNHLGVN
jgi:hypothetical protein